MIAESKNRLTPQEYLLIDTGQMSVDRYRRLSPRRWELQTVMAEEALDLQSVGWEAPLALLYEDVPFEEAGQD